MKILIRVDASLHIGTGHLHRCLNLADVFKARGSSILFAINDSTLDFQHTITKHGHDVVLLNKSYSKSGNHKVINTKQLDDATECVAIIHEYKPKFVIVDHYKLDYKWEQVVKLTGIKLIVIDDLADRKHDCDIVLDQTPIRLAKDYKNLLRKSTKLLIGPTYNILKNDFNYYREKNRNRLFEFNNIFIGIGSLDSPNLIPKILESIQQDKALKHKQINIVISSLAPQIELLRRLIDSLPLSIALHIDSQNLTELMSSSDYAISAGGLMSLELACLGIPSLILPLTKIQSEVSDKLAEKVHFVVVHDWQNNFESKFKSSFVRLTELCTPGEKRHLHNEIDGLGTSRIVEYILEYDEFA